MFASSAILLLRAYDNTNSDLFYWYRLALWLFAIAFGALFFGSAVGDPLAWLARIGQYLGSLYFLVGAMVLLTEMHSKRMSATEVMASFFRDTRGSQPRGNLGLGAKDACGQGNNGKALSRGRLLRRPSQVNDFSQ